jgi:Tfp pilus assembly protein PilF
VFIMLINQVKKLVILCFITLAALACSKDGEPVIVGGELTESMSVTAVVQAPEPEISAGNQAFLQGDFNQAISYYETAMRENRAAAFYNIGVSQYMLHNIVAAEEAFRSAVIEDPNFDEAIMNLVAVLAEQEKTMEAEQYISRLVNKRKTARVYVDMANLSIKNGSSAKARLYYERALEIDRREPFVVSNYANYLISIGELDEGERILNQLEVHDFAVVYNLAYIAWLRGDLNRSFILAEQASTMADISEDGNNKLAVLFAMMKRYNNEQQALRRLIAWNPKVDYRIRLVRSYMHAGDMDRAQDEVAGLSTDHPDDADAIIANYDVMIARNELTEAGRFIRESYQRVSGDKLFYQTVRHISLYDFYPTEARTMLTAAAQQDTPFVNLARTVYALRENNYPVAEAALDRVPEDTYNDYYSYRSFLLLKKRLYSAAEEFAHMIDITKPEYFWYNFVLAWNQHDTERVQELLATHSADYVTATRVPTFTYSLNPVAADMNLTFKPTGVELAAQLLYPFFIEPDEMYPFISLGYKFLKENESAPALAELKNSITYSNAVIENNEGVALLMQSDYEGAMAKFTSAEPVLDKDPFVQYNIGLVEYLLGNSVAATDRFDRAIRLNRYIVPAYVGKGIIAQHNNEPTEANHFFNAALTNADEYLGSGSQITLPMIVQARYLALLAQNNSDRIMDFAERERTENNFSKAILLLSEYLQTKDQGLLAQFSDTNIYRSHELAYLLNLAEGPQAELAEQPWADRNTIITGKYLYGMRTGQLTEQYMQPYMTNQDVLIRMVYLSTLLKDRAAGLRYLQTLSRIDVRYAPQYLAGLYYFIWAKEFPNAEASYTVLDNMGNQSQELRYYTMLYFLINYNQRRYDALVDMYREAFPRDYRGKLMEAAKSFQNGESTTFLSQISELLRDEPELFEKMPLEIDIDRF